MHTCISYSVNATDVYYLHDTLLFSTIQSALDVLANSVDPDEPSRNEPSHPDLHCLQTFPWFSEHGSFYGKPIMVHFEMQVVWNTGGPSFSAKTRGCRGTRLLPPWTHGPNRYLIGSTSDNKAGYDTIVKRNALWNGVVRLPVCPYTCKSTCGVRKKCQILTRRLGSWRPLRGVQIPTWVPKPLESIVFEQK